ncbi:MAG: signal recognition particle protein [Deltaproteobacteria bacterium]|nr:signal recognition particle protein [Deltaproteobacteria bacterium]
MFDGLQDRLSDTFKKLRGHGTLTEKNIEEALREVRMALLEADVHYSVVKSFVGEVKTRSLGQDVMAGLNPYQEFIRIVSEELTRVMGGGESPGLDLTGKPPVVLLMMGLQGSGKTTSTGKLALRLKAEKKTPLLVPADVRRPAAIEQLKTLAKQVGVSVYDTKPDMAVLDIAKNALAQAERQGQDVVIFDTAGRLHVDLELMDELRELKEATQPKKCLLVVDAMTGQDAVNVAQQFQQQVGIDGVVLTKMDGDARGGAALSVRMVTGAPILLVGTGEKLDKLELFHPTRVAQRILGMGDVMSLIEKTAGVLDEKKAKSMAKKLKKADFSLDDFRDQMKMIRQMGDMKEIMKMIPGMDQAIRKMGASGPDPDKELRKIEAMINSMTPDERSRPEIINGSRKKRIASGSGTDVAELNGFLKRFNDMKKIMKRFTNMGPGGLKSIMRKMGMG